MYLKEDEATKRSVLDALWRAFQAITGGALTIGGHLAKGSGAILQAKGKLIASAGPVVSEFGKTIATKAAVPSYAPTYVSYLHKCSQKYIFWAGYKSFWTLLIIYV